jgi:AraC family transcriptional regulator
LAVAVGGRARPRDFGGLEQFAARGSVGDIGYCIAGASPYALEFNNDDDVICLLLGDILSATKFEDDPERPLRFAGHTSAFHPRGGNVRVRADEVRRGFIAFSYGRKFEEAFDDIDLEPARRAGSRNNIRKASIDALAKYTLGRLSSPEPLSSFEMQSLASLLYLETIRALDLRTARPHGLSDAEFAAIRDYIDAELANEMTCARLASVAGVPLRVVFDGMRQRTGMSPHRFVLEKRIERAGSLLSSTRLSIAEIALACGFSSQAHMTSTLSKRLGITPRKLRLRNS